MTEEDQILVALAALHGARFVRTVSDWQGLLMWSYVADDTNKYNTPPGKWTIGRAAEHYLYARGLRSVEEHREYHRRTGGQEGPVEVDSEFIASVLS